MLFTRVASLLTVLTFGLVALANPVEKRQTDPLTLVTGLQTKVSGLTSQLQGINSNSAENTLLAQSVASQLISTFEEAHAQAAASSLTKRQDTAAAVGDVLGAVVSDVGTVLAPVVVLIPILAPLVTEIDIALNGIIVSLDVVVAGLVVVLNSVLVGVAGILNGLGLTLLLATIGL